MKRLLTTLFNVRNIKAKGMKITNLKDSKTKDESITKKTNLKLK